MYKIITLSLFIWLFAGELPAKIDLVTLPIRDQIQLTIYNPADLTLVREQRTLTLKRGINRLEFSWVETLIDPTSIHLEAPQHIGQVNLLEVSYPPNVEGSAIWIIESQIAGEVPVEIRFFTSGIAWRAFYLCTLSNDEQTMRLQNYVRVDNQSGEDYMKAQTRVVVGKIHLLDEITQLAKRSPPYGVPIESLTTLATAETESRRRKSMYMLFDEAKIAPKQIIKEGLSEYFLYTIEGTESIRNGWGKRLLALEVEDIPVRALYRYDEHRYGTAAQRLLFFKNQAEYQLGKTPLPDGQVMIYRQVSEHQHLSYLGHMHIPYIPIGQEIELDLGVARHVKVEPLLMGYQTENYLFDHQGYVSGFDRVQQWQIKLENNRDIPVDIEIFQHFEHPYWHMQNAADRHAHYEKVDVDTVKYRLTLPPYTKEYKLLYTLTLFEGERQQKR